jgi:hypothetical protein
MMADGGQSPVTVEDSREHRGATGVELQQQRMVEAGFRDAYTLALGIKSRLFLPNSGRFSTFGLNIKISTKITSSRLDRLVQNTATRLLLSMSSLALTSIGITTMPWLFNWPRFLQDKL